MPARPATDGNEYQISGMTSVTSKNQVNKPSSARRTQLTKQNNKMSTSRHVKPGGKLDGDVMIYTRQVLPSYGVIYTILIY
jgi:hypothetical protein